MTKQDHIRIEKAIAEIRKIASLQTTRFTCDDKKDAEIKDAIRPWMTWFEYEADKIEAALHGKPF